MHACPPPLFSLSLPSSRCLAQIWLATVYLTLYGVYVTIVFRGPKGGKGGALSTGSSPDGVEVGGFGSSFEDHAVDARWM